MATLTVLKFHTPEGAKNMLGTIQSLQKEELITLLDAAILTWPVGKGHKPNSSLAWEGWVPYRAPSGVCSLA